jgi:hypothetical protein
LVWKRIRRSLQNFPASGWLLLAGIGLWIVLRAIPSLHLGISILTQIKDQEAAESFVTTLSQVLADVLGFTISVVAIVVQLSADRFTPKVTELFLREKINFLVILTLIIANLIGVWTIFLFGFVDNRWVLVILNLVLGTLSFMILIPYFIFVLNFISPSSILDKIKQQIYQLILQSIAISEPGAQIISAHQQCLSALDEIKAMATSAILQRESPIMLDALDNLKNLAFFYIQQKSKLPEHWFKLTAPVQHDPDFVSVDMSLLRAVETQRIWLELKIFRMYQAIFIVALNQFRDACYIISINTRAIAEQGLHLDQLEITRLAIKFFNTYLRALINTQDIRTGYNILKQYRQVAEVALSHKNPEITLEIAQYFRYYSLIAYKAGLLFLPETFAYDLLLLTQRCCEYDVTIGEKILAILLKIDQDPESEQQESTLRGIRKSQAKLAAYFLKHNLQHLAHTIYQDMRHEPPARLKVIYEELQSQRSDFWEFTDRGEDFYYLSPELQPYLTEFFSWFRSPPTQLNAVN